MKNFIRSNKSNLNIKYSRNFKHSLIILSLYDLLAILEPMRTKWINFLST